MEPDPRRAVIEVTAGGLRVHHAAAEATLVVPLDDTRSVDEIEAIVASSLRMRYPQSAGVAREIVRRLAVRES